MRQWPQEIAARIHLGPVSAAKPKNVCGIIMFIGYNICVICNRIVLLHTLDVISNQFPFLFVVLVVDEVVAVRQVHMLIHRIHSSSTRSRQLASLTSSVSAIPAKEHSSGRLCQRRSSLTDDDVAALLLTTSSYLVIELADAPTQNILGQLPAVCAFVSEGLAGGGAVLIHGLNGISRRFGLISRDGCS